MSQCRTEMPVSNVERPTGPGAPHIEIIQVERLTPYAGNARTHSKTQIRQIAKSIERFGHTNPILIDDGGQIIAGHGRVEAAKLLGIESVPALRLSHLSAANKRAYVIADNRLAEKAGGRGTLPARRRGRNVSGKPSNPLPRARASARRERLGCSRLGYQVLVDALAG